MGIAGNRPYEFDPEKARQLLADAGYPGGEGFGKVIVNSYKSPYNPFMAESAQLGAEFWRRELGLTWKCAYTTRTPYKGR